MTWPSSCSTKGSTGRPRSCSRRSWTSSAAPSARKTRSHCDVLGEQPRGVSLATQGEFEAAVSSPRIPWRSSAGWKGQRRFSRCVRRTMRPSCGATSGNWTRRGPHWRRSCKPSGGFSVPIIRTPCRRDGRLGRPLAGSRPAAGGAELYEEALESQRRPRHDRATRPS